MSVGKEYYIPGLGIVNATHRSSDPHKLLVEVEIPVEDLSRLGAQEIVSIPSCGGCDMARPYGFEGDYLCIECREAQGDVEYYATWEISLRNP